MSLPKDMQVKHGRINAESKLQEMIIHQASKNGIINWSEFSIGEKEKVLFSLPNGDSKTLNRVIGDNLSEINGKLSSNGTIYLINQNGILIGPNGSIQTKGFVGSTLDLSNEDFLSKSQKFYGTSAATIENNGLIETEGNVCLFAKELINQGLINSKKGNVYLLSSNELIYQPHASEEIYYKIPINDPEEVSSGKVVNSGIIEADTLQEVDGRVYLIAKDGDTEVHGDLKAQEIRVLGKQAHIYETANLDASNENGGTILIGGDYKGQNPEVQNANLTWVAKGATINADGTNGDGGKIISWSDYATYMYGSLSAKSQANGDGGFIEISSPYTLDYSGDVNASSVNGKAGTVLFDPSDITISAAASSPAFPTTAGPPTDFYNPAGVASGNLDVTDLQTALNGGNNVTIQTSAGTGGLGDVTFTVNVSWSAATTLTVQADRTITVNSGVTLSSTSASSGFTAFDFTSNSGGATSGDFDGMFLNTSTISAVGGDITLSFQAGDTSNNNFGMRLDGGTVSTTGAGSIDITGIGSGVAGGRGVSLINTSSISASGTGNVTVTGSSVGSSTNCDGITMNSSTMSAQNGTLTLDGRFGGTSGSGIEMFTNTSLSTTTGDISVTGIGDGVSQFGLDMTSVSASITSTSGNISITTDTILIPGTITSSGTIVIEPFTASTTIGLGTGSSGTLNLDNTELGSLTDGFSLITFGRTDGTGAVDMRAFTYLDPIVVQGESITTNGAIAAGANDVTFNVGVASAGTLNLDNGVTTTGTFSINGGANNDAFNINTTSQTATLNGSGGTNTLSGPNAVNAWTITANNAGTQDSITFTNIQNLTGGTNNDTFTFSDGVSVSGTVDGTSASGNEIDLSAYTSNVSVNLQTGAATGTGGFANIQSFVGGSGGSNTFTGANVVNAWSITSNNTGTVGSIAFDTFQNLTGGTNNDTFTFSDGISVSGTVDGTSASGNEIDLSAYTSNVSVNLQTSAATGTGGFANIQSFVGGSGGSNTFTGANAVNAWTITADDTGSVSSITFATFENLEGGTSNDTFTFNGAFQISGSIDGTAGTNAIEGPNVINAWAITSNNGGTITPTGALGSSTFANIQNLTGGTNNDTFTFSDGVSVSGTVDGTSASGNEIDLSAYTTNVSVNLQTGAATGTGGFANIQSFVGGSGGSNTFTGANVVNAWSITSNNTGTVGSIAFDTFQNLTGGTNNDTFTFSDAVSVSGTVNGTSSSGNTLNLAAYTTDVTVNLATSTATGTGGIANLQNYIGSATATENTIFGPNTSTWTITANNGGTVDGSSFTNFQNAIGGTSNDTFTFIGNFQLTGTTGIDGGAGNNTIVGPNLTTDWQVTSTNAGTLDPGVGTTSFTNIQNLTGGSGTDSFLFADGQGLDGAINGGAPAAPNTLNYSAFTTPVTINLITTTSGTASNLGAGFSNIGNIIGNVIINGPPLSPAVSEKFNSLDTQLFLTLNEVRHFRLIEEFAWLQFNDPILWLLDVEKLRNSFIIDQTSIEENSF